MDWRSKAACLSVDPELFFPIGNTGPAIAQAAQAKTVCHSCPVEATCLQWAIDNNQDSGVWGGMSEEERRSLKRRAARARRDMPRAEPSAAPRQLCAERRTHAASAERQAAPPPVHTAFHRYADAP